MWLIFFHEQSHNPFLHIGAKEVEYMRKWDIRWHEEQMILFYNRFLWKWNRSTRTLHILYGSFTEVSQYILTEYEVKNNISPLLNSDAGS